MSRAKSRNRRQQQYESYHQPYVPEVKPRTFHQAAYIKSIRNHQLTFGIGPAGCGKTWLCAALSAHALMEHGAEKIVITRPVVEAEERLGFLPGNAEDKFAPYFAPFREVLEEFLGKGHVSGLMKAGRIEIAPLAYMRGRTFKNAWVVLDEAQNVTLGQMKLFLTRIGENARVIVNGDLRQSDVQGASGLRDAISSTPTSPTSRRRPASARDRSATRGWPARLPEQESNKNPGWEAGVFLFKENLTRLIRSMRTSPVK